jgi:hypothetical protein
MKFSVISYRISSFRLFLWVSLVSLGQSVFVLLESGTGYPFSSFPSSSCTNLFLVGEWFPPLFHLSITPLVAFSVPGLCVILYLLTYNSKTNETKKEREKRKKRRK